MKLYELNYLISADIAEKELPSFNKKIKSLIEKEGGNIQKTEISSEKRLAYEIENKNRVFLATIIFNLEAEKINLLNKKIKEEKDILRHLIFKKKIIEERKPRLKKIVKPKKETKVELKRIEEKLEEILQE